MPLLIELAGWTGMALIVTAFFLVSRKKLAPDGRAYLLMNIAGSVGIGADVLSDRSWPALALQLVWITIALTALARRRRRK